jgi:hypothetical protein
LLAGVSEEERTRLLQAAGRVSRPDATDRRRLRKAQLRQRKSEKSQRAESVLAQTGIRALRRETVFTTPNVYPPSAFEQREIEGEPDFREVVEPQNCYICKQDYSTVHHFYDQLCPACAGLNFRKRTELADLRGRVALLTGGRVKNGYRAGLQLPAAGALIVATRFRATGGPLRGRAGFQRVGPPARNLRARSAPLRRVWKRSAGICSKPGAAGFHHQCTRPCGARRVTTSA